MHNKAASASMRDLHRESAVRRVILLEGLANFIVLSAKLVIGLTTGSMAVVGDALHSLTDLANNVVAWAVVKHSAKPADREHPYGHHKFETLAVLGLAVLLVVLAFELVINTLRGERQPPQASWWETVVMVGVLLVNVLVASWQRHWANRLNSAILQADTNHTFSDVLVTLVVIAGWQLSAHGFPLLDKFCAVGVALVILYLAYELIRKATPVLVDEYAVDPDQIAELAMQVKGVKRVYRIRSRWIGNHASLDMIIQVAAELTLERSHEICDELEVLIEKQFAIADISIHVEPYGS